MFEYYFIIATLSYSNLFMSRGFLGDHPQLYRKVNTSTERFSKPLQPVDMQAMAEEFIAEENNRIYELEMQIKAYQVKIDEEANINLDHSEEIAQLEEEIRVCRAEEARILQQIQNCRKVENQVSPMQYYLWKKKQRVNTYDASIAQLCKEIQQQRQYFQRSIEEHRRFNEDLLNEIQELEEKIANFISSPRESIISPIEAEQQDFQQLFSRNITLKEQCSQLTNENAILDQNREIVKMQVVDNIDSTVSTLRSFFEEEKTKLVREFKQLQAESKMMDISPLTREEQNYNIEPLINDYAHKLSELSSAAPENVRKFIQPALQPLPWKSFNWKEFLDFNPDSENIYDQYRRIETQITKTQKQTEQLQLQLRGINGQIVNEQQRYNEIITNISRLKKNLQK